MRYIKYIKIKSALFFLVFLTMQIPFSAFSQSTPNNKSMVLWYEKPAGNEWLDGLLIGNGYMGGNVFGRIYNERIALNESSFWSGRPMDYNDPNAHKYFEQIKNLVWTEHYKDAENLTKEHFFGKPAFQQSYEPLGDLLLEFKKTKDPISNYYRELNMGTGIVKIHYMQGKTRIAREIFMSYPDHVMVMKISANQPGMISLEAKLKSPFMKNIITKNGRLILNGIWKYVAQKDNPLIAKIDGTGMSFQTVLVANSEKGKIETTDSSLVIDKANSVTFILTAATSFVNYRNINGNSARACENVLVKVKNKNYEQLKNTHIKDFSTLMNRVDFKLGDSQMNMKATDERLNDFRKGKQDLELWSKIFQFGRYLLVSSSRLGGQPANLQGIWNEELLPMWGSKYTLNINYQMNYWAAENTNLSECHLPMFAMLKELAESGSITAKNYYNARGWVAHHNTDIWRGTAPVDYVNTGLWPGGGMWLCQHIWEHYLYTGDKAFLKEYYPIMKGAAQFVMDVMRTEPKHNWLVIPFSISPEESALAPNGETACLSMSPTINIALIKDLFPHVIEAGKILDIDRDFGNKLSDALTRIPPYQLDSTGSIKTWIEDWKGLGGHNTSPVWGWFPGNSITKRGNPVLGAAIEKWVTPRRISSDWGSVWTICDWARLENGVKTDSCLHHIFTTPPRLERSKGFFVNFHTGIANNLHNIVYNQSDASYGITAAIVECLMQSHAGEISILPALPVSWKTGSISGLKARGGFVINISWENGKLLECKIKSLLGNPCIVRYGEKTKAYHISAGETVRIIKTL